MRLFCGTSVLLLAGYTTAAVIGTRQNEDRPIPDGECCIAETSLKQDTCITTSGVNGRCVPGGNDCGGALSCIEEADLECNETVQERGSSLCRAVNENGGLFEGDSTIESLDDAEVS